ncbi:hypothetical protein [Streptomyces avermitilis]|uniref:hypothetical protein n=1 Tax=Streptomyces avermitilis TaxID=33903 RepID=UPI0033BF1753
MSVLMAPLSGKISSSPTAYRQLGKLKTLGLIHHEGELYYLSPTGLEGIGTPTPDCVDPVTGWPEAAERLGTAGAGECRRRHHEAQRIHWRHEQVRLAERRRAAQQIPLPHPAVAQLHYVRTDGCAIDPITGEVIAGLHVASDGRWVWDETDQRGGARRYSRPLS